jgi:SRSO17 transposase
MFRTRTHDSTDIAGHYLCGLMQAQRQNMERMEEAVPGSEYEALQHFISGSPWDERAVFDEVARQADGLLGGMPISALLIDETSFSKKGKGSVGVAHQYSGRLGQTTNCQVAVYAALSAGNAGTLVDMRLFLPDEWIDDPARCERAGVPENRRVAWTKIELAEAIIRHQVRLGTRFTHVVADALYGASLPSRNRLDDMGLKYVVAVRSNQRIYLDHPQPVVPKKTPGPGRKPRKRRSAQVAMRAADYAAGLEATDWHRESLRDSAKGPLVVDLHARRVWTWDGESADVREVWLLLRRDLNGDLRYALSNEHADIPLLRLGQIFAQRHWIERQFQDAKQDAGMGGYQVRGWRAWHHHMAMVLIAMLFLLRQRHIHRDSIPLLSTHDIRTMLFHFLPRKNADRATILDQMERRHAARQADIDRATAKAHRRHKSTLPAP